MITARVSHVAAYARWKADEESSVDWLINSILSNEQTEAMAKGTAFHKFLEHASAGVADIGEADGYTFTFVRDFDLYLPTMRELRLGKDYGGITVSGQVDAIEGATIYDHKTTARFDAEGYMESWQWRFYLDIFSAERFVWNVWEMVEDNPMSYEVRGLHVLEQYLYPSMHQDCAELAQEYLGFARRYMPQLEAA